MCVNHFKFCVILNTVILRILKACYGKLSLNRELFDLKNIYVVTLKTGHPKKCLM